MENHLLSTDRLWLRAYLATDADFVVRLLNTPKWKEYIGDRGVHTLEDAEQYILEKYLTPEQTLPVCVCVRKEDGVIVGTCGLYQRPNLDHPDIGFALLPEFEGKGYAFEAASAVLDYAMDRLGIKQLHGITMSANKASQNLLRKLNFTEVGPFKMEGDEEELLLFKL